MSAREGSPEKTLQSNEPKVEHIGEDKNEACQIMVNIFETQI